MSEIIGRVLVVDSDYQTLIEVATALRMHGHQVALATDGRAGLQHAVDISAEVVLVDRDLDVFDIRTFIDILRDNPRTSDAHVFLMGRGDASKLAAIDSRAEALVKPFHAEEIARRVDEVIQRKRGPRHEPELKGDLAQVAIFDLLQVFTANRRTGRLQIEAPGTSGAIFIEEGRVIDALHGTTSGEKALYRLLTLREGRFVFVPRPVGGPRRIEGGTDQLLMEGARRADEAARIRPTLPSATATLAVSVRPPPSPLPGGALASELLSALDEPRMLDELLDLSRSPDLETLQTVRALVESGAIEVLEDRGRIAFCDDAEVPAMRAAAIRQRRTGVEGPARVGVLARNAGDVARFARALGRAREFVPATEPPTPVGDAVLGSLGALRIGGTELELFALPLDETLRPLWGPFLASATTAIVLGPEQLEPGVDALGRALDLQLVPVGAEGETPSGAIAAVRKALGAGRTRG